MLYITTEMFNRLKANKGLAGTFCTPELSFNRKYKNKADNGKFVEVLADITTGASAIVEMCILSYRKTKLQLIKANGKHVKEIKKEKGFAISMTCNLITITSEKEEGAMLEDYIMDLSDISDI